MSATVVRPISTFNPVQSASHTTNTPSLPERQTTLSPRSPGHSVGAFTPRGHEHGRASVAPATLQVGCADFRWGDADHANPCQLRLLRALTESQALHTPHGTIYRNSKQKESGRSEAVSVTWLKAIWQAAV